MKFRVTILLAMILGSLASRGQDTVQPRYQSVFGDSSTLWYNYFEYLEWEGIGTDTRQSTPYDTANIDGTSYKILRLMENLSRGPSPYEDENEEYLRESPDHSKLYYKEYYAGYSFSEVLIMDLDLNIGDTLDTHSWSELPDITYDKRVASTIIIDTVYYRDGKKILRTNYYKRVYYDYRRDTLFFIEGIGPSFGPLYAGYEKRMSLTCYYRDGDPMYHGVMYGINNEKPCIVHEYYGNISNVPNKELAFTIYPNPTMNICNIALSLPSTYKITVISATGSVVHTKEIYGDKTSIDLQGQPCGVYFVTTTSSDGNKQTVKVIKS